MHGEKGGGGGGGGEIALQHQTIFATRTQQALSILSTAICFRHVSSVCSSAGSQCYSTDACMHA